MEYSFLQNLIEKLGYKYPSSIQEKILAFCLSEFSNIDLMWGTYADSSKGFCIEYTIPFDSTNPLSLLYRTNLYPVYYGKKDRAFGFFYFWSKYVIISAVKGDWYED